MELSNTIKLLRAKHNDMSQQDLANIVGCSRQTIISIETGKKKPSVEIALKISYALKTPMDQIFFLDESVEKETFCQKISDFFKCSKKSFKT